MILVIILLDIIIPGVVPKWAIFAPVFIPIFMRLGVAPQTVLAAYRVGDSPMNVVTPLMVYLPFIVTVAQRYQKKSGIGTIIALMLPYVLFIAVVVDHAVRRVVGARHPARPGLPDRDVTRRRHVPPVRSGRCRGEQVEPELGRQERRGELTAHAVAGGVEQWREHAQAALAGRHGDDPAADPALAGQPDIPEPVARRVVQAGRRHHGHHVVTDRASTRHARR